MPAMPVDISWEALEGLKRGVSWVFQMASVVANDSSVTYPSLR